MAVISDAPPGKADGQAKTKATPTTPVRKFTQRAAGTKLPWLDGKGARAIPRAPLESETDTPLSQKRSAARAPKSNTAPPPPTRKAPLAVPPGLRDSSKAGSSPSPATRHRQSQLRRASAAQKYPSPLRTPASHRPSISHAPQKRLSIVPHHEDEPEEDDFGDIRPRAGSLAPVPDHLEWSDTSESSLKNDIVSSASPEVVARVQFSPSQPAPTRTAFERIGDRRLSNAIEGLEEMVQDAIDVADDTEDRRHVEDIYDIIQDARAAIQDASEDPMRHLMTTTSPLSTSDSSTDTGVIRLEIPHMHNGAQRDSASFDWAYPRHDKHSDITSSSTSSSDKGPRGRSGFSTQSDLLLPPQPIQTASRDHVDFVLRPIARDQSRGRPRRRANDDLIHTHRHRHRHRRSSGTRSRSRSGRRHQRSSGFSHYDTSFDEEDPPVHAYGNELSVREQAHHHTFSLHRHHRRQPIARNWTTSKKRITATIACINTALLGIVVGIYVRPQSRP